ncbi:hypothetical protein BGZ63DRAFT_56447 [Mariannaea sp. PMI_226]|nr:hypothetical protein BGZ63DRAFT_56447 [Mariannaea sp. PMI_226]
MHYSFLLARAAQYMDPNKETDEVWGTSIGGSSQMENGSHAHNPGRDGVPKVEKRQCDLYSQCPKAQTPLPNPTPLPPAPPSVFPFIPSFGPGRCSNMCFHWLCSGLCSCVRQKAAAQNTINVCHEAFTQAWFITMYTAPFILRALPATLRSLSRL